MRVKDLDFGYQQIAVRDAKGNKDRLTMLPTSAAEALKTQLATVKTLHLRDLADAFGGVSGWSLLFVPRIVPNRLVESDSLRQVNGIDPPKREVDLAAWKS